MAWSPSASYSAAIGSLSAGNQQDRIGKAAQHLARFFRIAGLAQLAGTQQGHPRFGRETLDRLAGDALGQRRLIQRLGQAAESQPCLQIAGNGARIDEFTQQARRQLRVAATAAQHGQGVTPAHLVLVAQQGLQFAPRGARIALAQGQRRFGGTHGQRLRGALAPELQGLGGLGIVVGQQRDAGGAFGQAGVVAGPGSLQVPARSLGQLAGLEGEFAGHHRGQGAIGLRLGRGGQPGCHEGQKQQCAKGDTNHCGHGSEPGRKMATFEGRKLSAST